MPEFKDRKSASNLSASMRGPESTSNLPKVVQVDEMSSYSFATSLRQALETFVDTPLGQKRGNTIGASLRQEYLFVTSSIAIVSAFTYPAVAAILSGDLMHGIPLLVVTAGLGALIPPIYASYLRDTGKLKLESFWSKLVPEYTKHK